MNDNKNKNSKKNMLTAIYKHFCMFYSFLQTIYKHFFASYSFLQTFFGWFFWVYSFLQTFFCEFTRFYKHFKIYKYCKIRMKNNLFFFIFTFSKKMLSLSPQNATHFGNSFFFYAVYFFIEWVKCLIHNQ